MERRKSYNIPKELLGTGRRWSEVNNRGSGVIVILFGVLFIILAIMVVAATVTGFFDRVIQSEYLPAVQGYIVGAIVAIILFVIGFIILILGTRDQ